MDSFRKPSNIDGEALAGQFSICCRRDLSSEKAKHVVWPASQFRMSLVGFDHVFETAQPVPFAADFTLKVIPSTTLMLLKIVAYMDDQQRRAKDLDDIRGLLAEYRGR